jgi:hypothetical protein
MLGWLVGASVLLPAGVMLALIVVDPYDSGLLGSALRHGVPPQGPRTAHASRVRDPAFDAAIIGNSRMQLLSPGRLSDLTGMRFVSLTIPGAGVDEQLALLRRFVQERGHEARAIVIGVDAMTCRSSLKPHRDEPFPYWLYPQSRLSYLRGLFRMDAAEAAVRRVAALLSGAAMARRDGWWNYEDGRQWSPAIGAGLASLPREPLADGPPPYGGVDSLTAAIDALPTALRVVVVVPPVFAPLLPTAGSHDAAQDRMCLAQVEAMVARRGGTALLDFRVESPMTLAAQSFWDATHYTSRLSSDMEDAIAAALGGTPEKR